VQKNTKLRLSLDREEKQEKYSAPNTKKIQWLQLNYHRLFEENHEEKGSSIYSTFFTAGSIWRHPADTGCTTGGYLRQYTRSSSSV
jgi:hypothetical protein